MNEHPDILDQAVVVQEKNGHKKLIAYYTARSGHTADEKALRNHLLSSLPDYMAPAHFIRLDGERLPCAVLGLCGSLFRSVLTAAHPDG